MDVFAAGNGPIGLKEAEEIRRQVKRDGKVTPDEKQIQDLLDSGRVKRGVVPALELLIKHEKPVGNELAIRGMKLDAIREVTVPLEQAKKVTADNGLDEVYFEDAKGKLRVAIQANGSLNGLNEGHRGHLGNQQVTVVHVDDEVNSAKEGAKEPFKSAKDTLQSLMTSGVTAGVGAIFTASFFAVGNTVVALRSTPAVGEVSLKAAAKAGSTSAGATIATAGGILLLGTALVMGGLSAKGAIAGARRKGDFSTLDMITK